jgi:serine/threonine protein kinase
VIGTTVSKYRILAKLGEGGMGAVYRAEDERLGRQVALKLLPALGSADAGARTRMLEEARAVSRLEHPNICTLYEFDEANGQPFIAMQLVEGESLREAISRGPLDEDRMRAIVAAVTSALGAAHAHGIVHRDVKSDNILLADSGEIKLADFGIALLDRDTRLTEPHMLVGTPHVMSPEQISGKTATAASDQFSFGVVVYECLTGTLPFKGESFPALMHAVLNEPPEPPSARRRGLHPAWDAAVMKALEKDPAQRHASISEFAHAIAATAPVEPRTRPSASGARSLAVLYFDNLSSDPESDYFCAGITEDLLTDLSKVKGLSVASRNAVGRYKGQHVDIPRVAAELGVDSLLEGSVRKAGNRVRINAQLIDASTGMHLWADRYDRTLDDVFAVQDELTSAIAKALRGALTVVETEQIMVARPESVRAYDVYLRGRAHYGAYTREDMQRALACFEDATRIDASYALAWAGIADACGQMIDKGYETDPKWLERGEAAGRRAVELAPGLPEAHKALSLNVSMLGHEDEAQAHLLRALAINPAFVPALSNLGSLRFDAGDVAGTERCLRRSVEVDPTEGFSAALLGFLCLSTGRYEQSLEMAAHLERWGTGFWFRIVRHYMRTLASARMGDHGVARAEVEAFRAAGVSSATSDVALAIVRRIAGEKLESPPESEDSDEYPIRDLYVFAAAAAGDADQTLRAIRRIERREPHSWIASPHWVRFTPLLDGIQLQPAIQEWLGTRGRSLVWPQEAPALPAEIRAQFTDFRIESGLPPAEGLP